MKVLFPFVIAQREICLYHLWCLALVLFDKGLQLRRTVPRAEHFAGPTPTRCKEGTFLIPIQSRGDGCKTDLLRVTTQVPEARSVQKNRAGERRRNDGIEGKESLFYRS